MNGEPQHGPSAAGWLCSGPPRAPAARVFTNHNTPNAWAAIVPQKSLRRAKSRISLAMQDRRRLAQAMLHDVVAAISSVEAVTCVMVAWEDPRDLPATWDGSTVLHVPVPGLDLNQAIKFAESRLHELLPPTNRVVFPGDLPGCSGNEIAGLLTEARMAPRMFMADEDGSGTTVLTALAGHALRPQYGPGSATEHLRSGARALTAAKHSALRCDIDTLSDLHSALAGVIGPTTQATATELGVRAEQGSRGVHPGRLPTVHGTADGPIAATAPPVPLTENEGRDRPGRDTEPCLIAASRGGRVP